MKADQNLKKLIWSGILLVAALVVVLIVLGSQVFAWFSLNEDLKGNVNAAMTQPREFEFKFSYDGVIWDDVSTEIVFKDFFPGEANKKTIYLDITNKNDLDTAIDLFFYAPRTDFGVETPFVESGKYYYLGSQIQISGIRIKIDGYAIDGSDYAVGSGQFLVPTSSAGVSKGQVTSINSSVASIPELEIIKKLNLEVDSNATIELDFTFVDNGQNQNAYQDQDAAKFETERKIALRW